MTRQRDLWGIVLVALAAAVGVWLGLSGPDISPIFTEAGLDGGGGRGDGPGR